MAKTYFFAGTGLLVLSIICIVQSLRAVKINILRVDEVYEAIPKYERTKILKGMAENYIQNLMINDRAKLRNQKYLRYAENCINAGILLMALGIIISVVI